MSIDWDALQRPFPAEDIEWRLQTCGKRGDKIWAICLAYVTNRAIMARLDEVLTPAGWQNTFASGPHGGVICGISIKVGDEWITKWDGAENTQVEAVKGGLSDSMKRAGYQWGIGRYLYNLDEGFAEICEKGKFRGQTKEKDNFRWNPPALPSWALPDGGKKEGKKKEHTGLSPLDAIKKALNDHCHGDATEMGLLLANATRSEKDGKEQFVEFAKLDTYPASWHGPILSKVRAYIEKEKANAVS